MKISGRALDQIDSSTLAKLNEILPRLAAKDPSIWGSNTEAKQRLGWLDAPKKSRELLPELDAITAWCRSKHYETFILCGMGGSSLAPEVISAANGKKLIILDSTVPQQILNSTPKQLEKTVIVIASKSGTTIETLSHLKYFRRLFSNNNLDPKNHVLVITDPNTQLDIDYRKLGYKVFNGDPMVGGRYSALTIFGLLPSALVGCDTSLLLDDADSATEILSKQNSPAVQLAAVLYKKTEQFIYFIDSDANTPGLSNWIEQLISESTGKNGKGRMPVVLKNYQPRNNGLVIGFEDGNFDLIVKASLGEHFILWQWVTALLCYLLSVDPFDQPNVAGAKKITSEILDSKGQPEILNAILENNQYSIKSNLKIKNVTEFIDLKAAYFAILAYLPQAENVDTIELQNLIFSRTHTPTTFGWGPRYLHSTGQIHKGGPKNGAFIQITQKPAVDLDIPSENYTFGELAAAQARGDVKALTELGLPVLQIHLKNAEARLPQIFN
jgi:glucose-6-phosphate isomerase